MDAMIDAAVGIGDSEARAAAYAEIQQKRWRTRSLWLTSMTRSCYTPARLMCRM